MQLHTYVIIMFINLVVTKSRKLTKHIPFLWSILTVNTTFLHIVIYICDWQVYWTSRNMHYYPLVRALSRHLKYHILEIVRNSHFNCHMNFLDARFIISYFLNFKHLHYRPTFSCNLSRNNEITCSFFSLLSQGLYATIFITSRIFCLQFIYSFLSISTFRRPSIFFPHSFIVSVSGGIKRGQIRDKEFMCHVRCIFTWMCLI